MNRPAWINAAAPGRLLAMMSVFVLSALSAATQAGAQSSSPLPSFVDERRLPDDADAASRQRQSEEDMKRLQDESERLRERLSAETEARRKAEEEAARKRTEEEAERQRQSAESRRKAEEEAARQRAAEEAERQRQAAEAARKAEEEVARKRAEEEAERQRQAAEAARKAKEEAARQRAEEEAERQRQAAEARRKAEQEAARQRAEEEAERQRQAAEARRKAEQEAARQRAEEEAERQRQAAEARRKAEQEAARKRAEEESERQRQAAEARRKAEEEAARKRAAEEAERQRQAAEARRKAEEEAARKRATARSQPKAAAEALAGRLANAGGPCQDVQLATKAQPAGRLEITLSSRCLAGRNVAFEYAGHDFIRTVSADGQLTVLFDLFEASAPLSLKLDGGGTMPIETSAVDLSNVSKVAVLWTAPVNLDLHAHEYLAPRGGPGHVWSKAPASLDDAVSAARQGSRGRGFLSMDDTGAGEGTHAEVYTFLHNSSQRNGAVTLLIDYETRGDIAEGDYCGNGRLATVEAQVVRLRPGGRVEKETVRLGSAPCGQRIPESQRFNSDTLSDLVARR